MIVVSPVTGRRLIPLPEAARRLRRSYGSLYGVVIAGRIAAERIDGRWCVDELAVVELVQASARHTARDDA